MILNDISILDVMGYPKMLQGSNSRRLWYKVT